MRWLSGSEGEPVLTVPDGSLGGVLTEAADLHRARHRLHDRLCDARRLHGEVGVHQPDVGQVPAGEIRVVDQTLHDGDEARIGGRDLVLLEHAQRHTRIEIAHREISAADIKDGEHRQHGGDVEHRQGRPQRVRFGEPVAVAPQRDRVADLRFMRDQAAFRVGGRAGGVEH